MDTTAPDPSDATIKAQPPVARTFAGGRYVVRRVLGEGGQKVVHLVHDEALDRDCALSFIKADVLEEDDRSRLRREAQAMAGFGAHPNIVTVFDIGEEDGRPYLLCEYIPGGDLRTELRAAGGPLSIERALAIATDLAGALAVAHEQGVIHRDLKPANIWLGDDGGAKVGDFGLAIALGASRLTISGMMAGTPTYLSPEQALGGEVDARSDLYSLGVVLYEMATGRPPFLGDDIVAVISQHINTPPMAPSWHNPQVPKALDTLILRLLAKAPDQRPNSAAIVRDAINGIAAVPPASLEGAIDEAANPLDQLARGVFVGREKETTDLRRNLEEAISGSGRLVLLAGEPGIGKTRMADELCTYAQLRGVRALVGRCYEGEGAPAYWPWVQIIRSYARDRDPAELMSEMGPGAGDIAQVVPEVRERLPDLPVSSVLEPEQARFRLFDSITTFFKNADQHRPLVLVLDDLHWADKPSLLLLQFLVREMRQSRLLIIGAYRDMEIDRHHPLTQTLAELAKEGQVSRVSLQGLTRSDIARFIEMGAGVTPPSGLVNAVYRETEGNAFFMGEVVRLLVSNGRLARRSEVSEWTIEIPQSVRDVVGRRLESLSVECNRVLTVASVVGREFDLDIMERATGLSSDRLLDALDEAQGARIISEVSSGVVRYGFSHALILETVYEELSAARRTRLHYQIGEAMERLYETRPGPHLAEMANHFSRGLALGNVDRAIDYATRAAQRSRSQLGYEEAVRLYRMALTELDVKPGSNDRQRCDLLLALGDAYDQTDAHELARETFLAAADIARNILAAEQLARAALGLERLWSEPGVMDQQLVNLLEEALAMPVEEQNGLRPRLLAALARAIYFSPARERGPSLSQEAVALARRLGDTPALIHALMSRHAVLLHVAATGPQNLADRLATATEIVSLAEELGDKEKSFQGHALRIVDLLTMGEVEAADKESELAARLADELRQPLYLWAKVGYRTTKALFEGRFAEAEGLAFQTLAIGRRARSQTALQVFAVEMFTLRLEQGRLQEMESVFKDLARQYPALPGLQVAVAFMYSELVQEQGARTVFDLFAVSDFRELSPDGNWLGSIILLSQVCAFLGRTRDAATLYRLLLPHAECNAVLSEGVVCLGSASRYLGILAATMSRWKTGERHFEDALETNRRMGARPWTTHTQYDYAKMLLARGGRGDRVRATALLQAAAVTAQELGMQALAGKVEALLHPKT